MSLVCRSFWKFDFSCTCYELTLQWNNNRISSLSHPLFKNVFAPINVWFQLQNDRKILVVCRFSELQSSIQLGLIFFLVWWVTLGKHRDASKKYFLSFQNPIIKCRALFAWVMFPNDFLSWKKRIMIEKLPGRRHCLYCLKWHGKALELAEGRGWRRALRFCALGKWQC